MQIENLQEQKFLKEEMINLNDCITSYMGYVLGGSGVAIFGLSTIESAKGDVVAYVALVLSLIFSLVLVILFYKFASYNRYTAYSKLLSHERHSKKQSGQTRNSHFISWQLCLERLRRSDIKPEQLISLAEKIKIEMKPERLNDLVWILKQYSGIKPPIDENKIRKGINHLFLALFGRVRTNSWAFPPYVVGVFFVLVLSFISAGIYGLVTFTLDAEAVSRELVALWSVSPLILLAQAYLWLSFCGKRYTLMTGSATVDGFFWRFLPIRAAYLNEYDVVPSYVFAEERLAEVRADSKPMDDAKTE